MDYGVRYKIDINGDSASRELTKFLNATNSIVPKVNKKFDSMNKKIKETLDNIEKLKRGLGGLNKIKLDINTKKTLNDVSKIKREINSIKNKKVKLTIQQKTTGKGSGINFGGGKSSLGKAFSPTSMMSAGGIPFATTLGAGLIGIGLKNIIGEAAEFQHTMVSVRAILRTTDKEAATFDDRFASMSRSMRSLGVDTKFTATEIGEATRFLAMAGMNVDTIQGSMKSITNLAAIGDTDLGEMADVVTNIMTGYGVGANQVSAATDNMTSVASRANVNVMEIGESMKYASNYMRMAGINFSEGAAAVGVLGNAGIKGSRAGTSLRAMIIRLIKPTNTAQKVIDRLGLSFTRIVSEGGKTKEVVKPLHEIFSDLKKSGASMQDLTAIFDKIGGGAAMALVDNLGKLKNLTEAAGKSGGLSDFLAEEKMKTVVGLSQQLKSKFLDLGQTMFDKLSPKITQMMEQLLGWMKTDEATKIFDAIGDGIGSVLNGLKSASIFIKNNWGWLKYVFGGVVAKNVLSRGVGMGANLIGGIRGAGSMLNTVGRFATGGLGQRAGYGAMSGTLSLLSGLGTAGETAALGIGSLTAAFVPLLAGGVIVAGIGAVGYKIWEAHKNAENMIQLKDDVADWSIKSTGMNTESLDLLQKKLDGIRDVGKIISEETKKTVTQKMWGGAVSGYDKMNTNRFFTGSKSGHKVSGSVIDVAKNIALSSQASKNIDETFLSIFDPKNAGKTNEIIGGMMKAARNFQLIGQPSMSLQKRMDSQLGLGSTTAERDRILKNSMEYNDVLNEKVLARIDQAQDVMSFISEGGQRGGFGALNALLGADMDIRDVQTTIMSRGLTKKEDIDAVLRSSGMSVPKIMTTLQSKGIQTSFIDSLLKMSGLSAAMESSIKSDSTIKDITTNLDGDSDDDGYKNLSGAGKLTGRTGKAVIVNIDKLWNVEAATFATEADLEVAKDKIAQALMDVVNDFEISNH